MFQPAHLSSFVMMSSLMHAYMHATVTDDGFQSWYTSSQLGVMLYAYTKLWKIPQCAILPEEVLSDHYVAVSTGAIITYACAMSTTNSSRALRTFMSGLYGGKVATKGWATYSSLLFCE